MVTAGHRAALGRLERGLHLRFHRLSGSAHLTTRADTSYRRDFSFQMGVHCRCNVAGSTPVRNMERGELCCQATWMNFDPCVVKARVTVLEKNLTRRGSAAGGGCPAMIDVRWLLMRSWESGCCEINVSPLTSQQSLSDRPSTGCKLV